MFILANLLTAIAVVIQYGLIIYMYLIIARAVISWVNADPYNPIVQFIYSATEPVLSKVRSKLPFMGGVDLSPIVVLMIIIFLKSFLVTTLHQTAAKINASENRESSLKMPELPF